MRRGRRDVGCGSREFTLLRTFRNKRPSCSRLFLMDLTPQERALLNSFRSMNLPTLRFGQVAAENLEVQERAAATRSLVEKGILARLGRSGEYWLTDNGVRVLGLRQ